MSLSLCPRLSVLCLGYVQASKKDKKFVSCPPNFSYAALCECICRTFVYRQPSPLETVLFNRKQGRQIEKVAKQHLASLDSDKPILGFRATNERVYILTRSNIFILKINNNWIRTCPSTLHIDVFSFQNNQNMNVISDLCSAQLFNVVL